MTGTFPRCCWAVIAAAGSGSRLADAGLDRPKQFLTLGGVPLYWHSARVFGRVAAVRGIVFVFPQGLREESEEELRRLAGSERFPLPWRVATGGEERQDSVRNALAVLPDDCDAVLVHDAARPFMTAALASRVLRALQTGREAVIPGLPLVDTIKEVDGAETVRATRDRQALRAVQTPQGFSRAKLAKAHEAAKAQGLAVTDDAALMESAGVPVLVVPGDAANRKITAAADLALL
ncbi:MAG: 2-C-methyl-D-erythritol 4-phosphate cytidylyltransferase, partial [Deltaproteobacteria bacterium]|nr:2-C-methyl-D-erythritol 4-phosphate cytidylyltransferase [Deltaproteobacteria bacterium]